MDKNEAKIILNKEIETFRKKSYVELAKIVDAEPIAYQLNTPSGTQYQIEVQTFWDDVPKGDIRVMGCIDDGGLRAFSPLTSCFIKDPTDKFVDE